MSHEVLSECEASSHRFENDRRQTTIREMKQNCLWAGAFLSIVFAISAQEPSPSLPTAVFDVIIRGGTVYDGTGAEPRQAAVAIRGDRIAGVWGFQGGERKQLSTQGG
jgi:hypothetical protein